MKNVTDVELRLLRIFVTVVDAGGFAAAQAALNLGASTVSTQMAQLERRLGARLCERGRAGFRLTEKGRAVYEAARRLLDAVEAFRGEASALDARLAGDLRVGLLDATAGDPGSPLIPALRRFGGRDHRVHLHLTIDTPPMLEKRLLDGQLDLAVGSFPRRVAGLTYTPLYQERHRFYCGAGHRLFAVPDTPETLPEIRRERLITRGYWNLSDLTRLGLSEASAAATVDAMEAQAVLILSGGYLGFLPVHYAAPWVAAGRLRPLLPDILDYDAPFEIVARKGATGSRAAQLLAKDLLEARRPPSSPTTRV
ncbi:DNA-binding transcriptional LysR family regulator [Inquilinus ginsengisoli]|uniref:DNA-binding transcriptional LysR family regulator n=1 Tax=Inquilinus ginsengisoli TaxID=363840 RepID=A0ABU1JGA6_9PROT|nr:LysR family transcriptional regulator [Inquilinus ginsengisoli]MDR6287645.1 DNA-binding transcriptional LysR family regulator [Inquilinus ginsengisoli]